ncbi:MAG TPA: IS1595 family transposase [Candidatus Baltobacteraceae bacterium]|nr:IS1595 family transposase [Candidatus Baltobacteraceae bacterium]
MEAQAQPVPETLLEAVRRFQDPQVAHDYFVALRWPNGVACPRACGSVNVDYMPKHRRWYCRDCRGQFSAKVGTIFEESPIGFDKWLPAIWLIASNRNGISSCELARALKVTQKTAWFMLHRIREGMRDDAFGKFFGPVEADETYVGGKKGNRGRSAGRKKTGPQAGKAIVMGIVQRKGKVRAWVVPSALGFTLRQKIRDNVFAGETVYTDQHGAYYRLRDLDGYDHQVINHALEYVRGHIHTNNIEGFWSVFKRMVKGTYIAPRVQHLQRYVEEEVFRFNERESTDGPRFVKLAQGADGKRLTYKALTAK